MGSARLKFGLRASLSAVHIRFQVKEHSDDIGIKSQDSEEENGKEKVGEECHHGFNPPSA